MIKQNGSGSCCCWPGPLVGAQKQHVLLKFNFAPLLVIQEAKTNKHTDNPPSGLPGHSASSWSLRLCFQTQQTFLPFAMAIFPSNGKSKVSSPARDLGGSLYPHSPREKPGEGCHPRRQRNSEGSYLELQDRCSCLNLGQGAVKDSTRGSPTSCPHGRSLHASVHRRGGSGAEDPAGVGGCQLGLRQRERTERVQRGWDIEKMGAERVEEERMEDRKDGGHRGWDRDAGVERMGQSTDVSPEQLPPGKDKDPKEGSRPDWTTLTPSWVPPPPSPKSPQSRF